MDALLVEGRTFVPSVWQGWCHYRWYLSGNHDDPIVVKLPVWPWNVAGWWRIHPASYRRVTSQEIDNKIRDTRAAKKLVPNLHPDLTVIMDKIPNFMDKKHPVNWFMSLLRYHGQRTGEMALPTQALPWYWGYYRWRQPMLKSVCTGNAIRVIQPVNNDCYVISDAEAASLQRLSPQQMPERARPGACSESLKVMTLSPADGLLGMRLTNLPSCDVKSASWPTRTNHDDKVITTHAREKIENNYPVETSR